MSVLANMAAQAAHTHFAPATTAQLVLGRIARRDPALYATLAARPDLCEAAWIELWERSTAQRHRLALAARPLGAACAERAITDHRPSVLTALLNHNPSADLAVRVPSTLIAGKLADQLTRCSTVPVEIRLAAATKASLGAQLALAVSAVGDSIDDGTIISWLAAAGPRATAETRALAQILLAARPQLTDHLLRRSPWLTQVVAGSIALAPEHLDAVIADAVGDRYALFALVSNPVVDPAAVMAALTTSPWRAEVHHLAVLRDGRPAVAYPLSEVAPRTLEWLLRRCQVSETRPAGRPLEALALSTVVTEAAQRATLRTVFESAAQQRVWEDVAARGFAALGVIPASEPTGMGTEIHQEPVGHADVDLTPFLASHPRHVPGTALMQLAVETLGDDLSSWENFASLAEEFDGPLGQLFDVARALR